MTLSRRIIKSLFLELTLQGVYHKHNRAHQIFTRMPGLSERLKSKQLNKNILDKSVLHNDKFKLKTLKPLKALTHH